MNRKGQPAVLVLGAGMTGLAAAERLVELGADVTVIEALDRPGGLARDASRDGFIADLGPHYIFDKLAEKLGLANRVEEFPYYEELYRAGRFFSFPFGMLKNPRYLASVAGAFLARKLRSGSPSNLDAFLRMGYGGVFKRDVLEALLKKWSGVSASELSMDLSARFEPANLRQALFFLKKFIFRVQPDFKRRDRIWVYPKGGMRELFATLAARVGRGIRYDEEVRSIIVSGGSVMRVETSRGRYEPDDVISTIPISDLSRIVSGTDAFGDFADLRFRGVIFLFLRYRRSRVLRRLWTWFPEPKFPFYRVSEPKNVFEGLGPEGETRLTVEIACWPGDDIWNEDPSVLAGECHRALSEVFGLSREEYGGYSIERASHAYPVYLRNQDELRRRISFVSPVQNLFLAGRNGRFRYDFLEECHTMGRDCADEVYRRRYAA